MGGDGVNADEFAAIRARHPRERHDCPSCDEYVCSRGPWEVCDAARLLAEVERLRKGLRAVLREHWESATPGSRGLLRHCGICSPQEKRWPCVTVLEARAALGGEE